MKHKHVTWLEISRKALKHNVKQFKKIVSKNTKIMAVVKSNAYGHGIVECAKIFKKAGCQWLGTVNLDEAILLRNNGIKGNILVLSYFYSTKLKQAVLQNITLTIYSYSAALTLSKIGKRLHRRVKIHFKVDTGTSRLGILPHKCIPLIKKINKLQNIKLEGIFTHFADAENLDQGFTNKQINQFEILLTKLSERGIEIPIKHLACSAATILNKKSHYDIARLGISLYGLWSIENNNKKQKKLRLKYNLKPALSWYTQIVQIKNLPAKTKIGYGCTYKTSKPIKIALIPVGYWDGYDRKLSNKGEVLVSGKRCKVLGRVCMNLTIIDITKLENIKTEDKVTIIGKSGYNEVTVDELADKIHTINYEIVTGINPLLPRIYN